MAGIPALVAKAARHSAKRAGGLAHPVLRMAGRSVCLTIYDLRFLAQRLGRQKAEELADWLDTRGVAKTPEFLRESDVEKHFMAGKSAEERFFIAVPFDSGARAAEFHNIQYEDIQLPNSDQEYVKLPLKEEYSKTKGRMRVAS
jgi:hypothetical protein